MDNDTKEAVMPKIISGIAVSICTEAIFRTVKFITSIGISKIVVSEWDSAYENINKTLYRINPKKYNKYRLPTNNKERFELSDDISYIIRLAGNNYIRVETYLEEKNKLYSERKIQITFVGKRKYALREKFLKECLNITDKKHILVQHLNEIKVNIIPHSFDNIILSPKIRSHIVNGLMSWVNSKEWYDKHQLVYKIGVFLYGKPGTGKSTIARAISTMFDNAPILTIDPDNVMNSIKEVIKLRNKYNRTIVVLIEDFDMFFGKREENSDIEEEDKNTKKQKQLNQNAIFQLLDGIYSTDNTIYIATTNYKDKLDSALIRYGRFDIQEELDYFNRDEALECVKLLDYDEECLDSLNIAYPVQPAYLQSKIMEYRAKNMEER